MICGVFIYEIIDYRVHIRMIIHMSVVYRVLYYLIAESLIRVPSVAVKAHFSGFVVLAPRYEHVALYLRIFIIIYKLNHNICPAIEHTPFSNTFQAFLSYFHCLLQWKSICRPRLFQILIGEHRPH